MKLKQIVKDYPITLTASVNVVLMGLQCAFTRPTFAVFAVLFTGAVLVRGRHTVTRMIVAAGIRASHHARFHRFFHSARWDMDTLWECLAKMVVQALVPAGQRLRIGIDDTAQKKTGGKIYGVGAVHDNRPAFRKGFSLSWGLTWVVATVIVRVELWGEHDFAIPILARLYRKQKLCLSSGRPLQSKPQLALEMIRKIAQWFPKQPVLLHLDGGYASEPLMKHLPEEVDVVGRARSDAAVYALPVPAKTRRRGRPRVRGRRLPAPRRMAQQVATAWEPFDTRSGKPHELKHWTVLWPRVFGRRPIQLVATRPATPDASLAFFYGTDLTMTPLEIVQGYESRWAIEILFHEAKERMGFEDPQCWTERSVERTAPFLLLVAAVVQHWFLTQNDATLIGFRPRWLNRRRRPAVPPSFSEMLAALRCTILNEAFSCRSASKHDLLENLRTLVQLAAHAA